MDLGVNGEDDEPFYQQRENSANRSGADAGPLAPQSTCLLNRPAKESGGSRQRQSTVFQCITDPLRLRPARPPALRGRRLTAPSGFHDRPERATLYQGPLPHSSICSKTEWLSEGLTIIPLRGPRRLRLQLSPPHAALTQREAVSP